MKPSKGFLVEIATVPIIAPPKPRVFIAFPMDYG